MFYTIYKITNKINKKVYIGKHQTKNLNDGYMGSGKHLKCSFAKYGIENFEKEILFQFDTEAEMNAKEAELVTEDFCLSKNTYNLCPGGRGGFGYINSIPTIAKTRVKYRSLNDKWLTAAKTNGTKNLTTESSRIKATISRNKKYPTGTKGFAGKNHSEETLNKLRHSKNVGVDNSQFGTMWITNGQENKKIKKDLDVIPAGWFKGRTK